MSFEHTMHWNTYNTELHVYTDKVDAMPTFDDAIYIVAIFFVYKFILVKQCQNRTSLRLTNSVLETRIEWNGMGNFDIKNGSVVGSI